MLFAQIMTWKSSLPPEKRVEWLKKRAAWKPPEGVKILAEYIIPAGGNKVVIIYDAQEVMSSAVPMRAPWLEYYDIDVYPTVPVQTFIDNLPQLIKSFQQ